VTALYTEDYFTASSEKHVTKHESLTQAQYLCEDEISYLRQNRTEYLLQMQNPVTGIPLLNAEADDLWCLTSLIEMLQCRNYRRFASS